MGSGHVEGGGGSGDAGGGSVTVIGVSHDDVSHAPPGAREALEAAQAVVGGRRHLELWHRWLPHRLDVEEVEVGGDVDAVVHRVWQLSERRRRVCLLASGDPGFFGILRSLLRVLDRSALRVLPAPSSVSLAFARLGVPWDDAVVVSAHGRPLDHAVGAIRTAAKVAVLTSPESPPEVIGQALLDQHSAVDMVAVCSRLGSAEETVAEMSLRELAKGSFDPLSVLVVVGPGGLPITGWAHGPEATETAAGAEAAAGARAGADKPLAWGMPEQRFEHRAGMITKPEVRAIVLGKLELPGSGVLWDLGAGSGSVGIEAALLRPRLTVFAVEASPPDAARVGANSARLGAGVHVVAGRAPEVTDGLPAPDRVFVGGGGAVVLEAAMARLRPGGRVVATYAAMERAAAAGHLLGNLVQVVAQPGERLADGSWRLGGRNPVFVAWGPGTEPGVGEGG